MKPTQTMLAFVALVPLLLPQPAWPANPVAAQQTDIALDQYNAFGGRVVDENGQPVIGGRVAIYSQGQLADTAVSAEVGTFSLVVDKGGVYELQVDDRLQMVRLWHHDTAPPHAKNEILLQTARETVRGQRPIESLFCFQPWFLGALIAAAIAIPIAVHDSDSRSGS